MNFRLFLPSSLFLLFVTAIPLSNFFPRAIACQSSSANGFSHQESVTLPSKFAAVISDLVFSPNHRLLAAGIVTHDWYGPGQIKIWQLQDNLEAADRISPFSLLHEFETRSHHLALSPDGQWLVSAEDGGKPTIESIGVIEIWNLETGKRQYRLNGNDSEMEFGGVKSIGITPDSQFLITGSNLLQIYDEVGGHNLQIWNLEAGTLDISLEGHPETVTAIAISPNGKLLASGGRISAQEGKAKIHLWDLQTRIIIQTLETKAQEVTALAISPNQKFLVSGSSDHQIRVWDLKTGNLAQVLVGHTQPVDELAISKDSKKIISSSRHETIRVWDLQTGKPQQTVTEGTAMNFAFSHKTEQLLTTEYRYREEENHIHWWENCRKPFLSQLLCHQFNLLCSEK